MITPSAYQYAYRSYIETLLAYSKEYKKSQAQPSLYFWDKDPANKDITKDDKSVELMGRRFSDILSRTNT